MLERARLERNRLGTGHRVPRLEYAVGHVANARVAQPVALLRGVAHLPERGVQPDGGDVDVARRGAGPLGPEGAELRPRGAGESQKKREQRPRRRPIADGWGCPRGATSR